MAKKVLLTKVAHWLPAAKSSQEPGNFGLVLSSGQNGRFGGKAATDFSSTNDVRSSVHRKRSILAPSSALAPKLCPCVRSICTAFL